MEPAKLGIGDSGDGVARLHEELGRHGLEVSAEEVRRRYFGPATRQAVRTLQLQNGLDPSGIADELTRPLLAVAAPPGRLTPLGPDAVVDRPAVAAIAAPPREPGSTHNTPRWVTGRILDRDGRPLAGAAVRAFARSLREEALLGEATTDLDGHYSIAYHPRGPRSDARATVNLRIGLLDAADRELASSAVRFRAHEAETIDLTLPEEANTSSELERYLAVLAPAIQDAALAEATIEEIEFLAGDTALPVDHLAALVTATRRAAPSHPAARPGAPPRLPAEVWYAWQRQGLDLDPDALWAHPVDELVATVRTAVNRRLVPASVAEQLDGLAMPIRAHRLQHLLDRPAAIGGGAPLRELLATLPQPLDAATQQAVAEVLIDERPEPGQVHRRLQESALTERQAADVARTLQLGELAAGNVALVAALQPLARDGVGASLHALAAVPPDTWLDLAFAHAAPAARSAGPAAVADGTPQIEHARRMQVEVEELHPTATLAARLADGTVVLGLPAGGQVQAFLAANPDFDIATTPIEEAVGHLPDQPEVDRTELSSTLRTLRRLHAVSTTWSDVAALSDLGLSSPIQIAQKSPKQLAEALDGRIPADEARAIHVRASAIHDTSLVLMATLPSFSPAVPAALPSVVPPPSVLARYPTLQALLGSLESCACGHCRSVLSPAAYLVDLLEFLHRDAPQAFSVLLARRPDLADLELSCENTNRELPAVDLALEVLENAAALPMKVDLPPGTDITATLAGAKLPPAILNVLRRTAIDVGDDLRVAKEPQQPEPRGFTAWTVTDRWRRWMLRQTEDALHAAVAGPSPQTQPVSADLDLGAVVAALDQKTLPPKLDPRLRPIASSDPTTQQAMTLDGVAVITPGRRWQVTYLTSMVVIGTVESPTQGTITITTPDGTTLKKKQYSSRAVTATIAALDKGTAGGMLTGLLSGAYKYSVKAEKTAGSWQIKKVPINLDVTYTPAFLTVAGLTYQSSRDDADLKALPLNRNPEAYDRLRKAEFPWSLPFDLPLEETRALLDRAGYSRLSLMELWFSSTTPMNYWVADEYLGLSPAERSRITSPASEPVSWRLWGIAPGIDGISRVWDVSAGETVVGPPIKVASRVSVLLQQAGLRHAELLDLLESRFVRGSGPAPSIVPTDECRPSAMHLESVDAAFFDRLRRFVLLWRRLGWTVADLDMAVAAFSEQGAITARTLYQLSHLERLRRALDLSVAELASWWGGIGTSSYRARTGKATSQTRPLFDQLFHDPTTRAQPDPDLTLNAARTRLLVEDTLAPDKLPRLRDKLRVVAPAFKVRESELVTLLSSLPLWPAASPGQGIPPIPAETHPLPLTLDTLTRLYRAARLARALGLTADDYVRAIRVTGIEPFPVTPLANEPPPLPRLAVQFREAVELIRDSGFTIREVLYLLRHRLDVAGEADERLFGDAGLAIAPPDDGIAAILTAVRAAMRAIRDEAGDAAVDPVQGLRTGLTALGWYPELVREVIDDLDGSINVELTGDGSLLPDLLDAIVIPPALADLVGVDGGMLVMRDFLPAPAWDRNSADSLYAAVPTTAPTELQAAFHAAVDRLHAAVRRLARRLQSAVLPVFTADTVLVDASFMVPDRLRGRCHVEPTPDGKGSRIVVVGWVEAADAAALAGTLGSGHATAVQALRTESDGYTEIGTGRRLMEGQQVDELLTAGPSVTDRSRQVLASVVRHRQTAACAAQLAQTVGFPSAAIISDLLLKRLAVPGMNTPAVELLLEADFAESDPQAAVQPAAFPRQFALVRRIHKVAVLMSRLQLDGRQLTWLAGSGPTPAATARGLLGVDLNQLPAGFTNAEIAGSFLDWQQMIALVRLRDRAPGMVDVLDRYVTALRAQDRMSTEDPLRVLATALDVPDATMADAASQVFKFGLLPWDPVGITCVLDLLAALVRLGLTAAQVPALIGLEPPFEDASKGAALARSVLRSRYGDAGWLEVIKPVSDRLRVRQRDALIAYLIDQWNLLGADDLYEFYLVDVQTGACLTTTRLLHATAAVQLFVHRCLLNLEPAVPASSIDRDRWEWIRNYRVWEANRKVFLWPQNWLYPELRDDASDAFRGVISALGQGEPSEETARAALRGYLDDLVELSQLTVLGMFEDDHGSGSSDLYVVARTPNTPYRYFWRVCEDFGGAGMRWRSWERVDLDVAGTHVMPFVLDGDLHLAWPVLRRIQTGEADQWEVQLAWARRTARGWSEKKVSRETTTADAYANWDEHRSFSFRLAIEDVPPVEKLDGAPLLDTGVREKQAVVRCYVARDPEPIEPVGDVMSKAATSVMELGCRVYLKKGSSYRFAAGAKVSVAIFSAPNHIDVFDMHDTDANGTSWGTFKRSLFPPGRSFRLTVQTQGEEKPRDCTLDAVGETAICLLEFIIDAKPATPWPAGDPDKPAVMAPLGSFMLPSGQDARWRSGAAPTLSRQDDTGEYDNGFLELSVRPGGKDDLRLGPSGGTISFQRTPGRFFLLPAGPSSSAARHYRDDAGRYFLRPVGFSWLAVADGYPLALRFRAAADDGLGTLFSPAVQAINDDGRVLRDVHAPEPHLLPGSSTRQGVSFDRRSPYGQYDWELFLHVPMLIADHLSRQQRFADAQEWLRLVFDPTSDEARSGPTFDPTKFWRFLPFRQQGRPDRIEDLLEWLANPYEQRPGEQEFAGQILWWKDNPFRPHEVARLRPGAYQWDVLFAYLDNLLDWGDDRFRRDTRESLVEATMLYAEAAKLLGPRPRIVEPHLQPPPLTYRSVYGRWDEFSNVWYSLADTPLVQALVAMQQWLQQHGIVGTAGDAKLDDQVAALGNIGLTYFCVPHNEKLVGYWNRVEDRLFKIRHCQNIDGVVRELPLFDPPIDPDLLVRAVAAGVSIEAALADVQGPVSQYRYTVLAQKAADLCGEVKALGAAVLAALEKKDAEQLAKLRSSQEVALLDLVTETRQRQVDEANANIDALDAAREAAATRFCHYQYLLTGQQPATPGPEVPAVDEPSRLQLVPSANLGADEQGLGIIRTESDQLARMSEAHIFGVISGVSTTIGSVLYFASAFPPDPVAQKIERTGRGFNALGSFFSMLSANASNWASRASVLAGHQRRQDDWVFQSNLARRELAQIDKQLAAARIRAAIAEHELSNHRQQISNARAVDELMRSKYTNEQLYTWMSGQLGAVYFGAYQLALDMAKQAERAFRYELARPDTNFVRPRYWDSLHKGLLAGERLSLDLRRMDAAYLEGNRREHELTRHVSLQRLDPIALLSLRATGTCEFQLPESFFDADCPGHYLRRLKSVGVSIPSVAGPYAAVHARLTLLRTTVRQRPDLGLNGTDGADAYARADDDARFVDDFGLAETIVTSGTVEATGVWEPGLRDERRLPFEGRGAISWWRLELQAQLRPFDYETISDVILHLRYSARDGGQRLRNAAVGALEAALKDIENQPQALLVSLRHQFPSEWSRLTAPSGGHRTQTFAVAKSSFPAMFGRHAITVRRVDVFGSARDGRSLAALPSLIPPGGKAADTLKLIPDPNLDSVLHAHADKKADGSYLAIKIDDTGAWTVSASETAAASLADLALVLTYTLARTP